MTLDEQQRKKVAEWISQGLKLSDIQSRLAAEFNLHVTYMDVRFLVDDLKLTPKDQERPKEPAGNLAGPAAAPAAKAPKGAKPDSQPGAAPKPKGGVSVEVDALTRSGAVVSGKVTFSDGNSAEWYFDQTGRLALAAQTPGYRPPPADLQQFQTLLEAELAKIGY